MNEMAMVMGFVIAMAGTVIALQLRKIQQLEDALETEERRTETLLDAIRDDHATIAFLQAQSGLHVAQMLTANLPLILRSVN